VSIDITIKQPLFGGKKAIPHPGYGFFGDPPEIRLHFR
jgi:hypothetical protein